MNPFTISSNDIEGLIVNLTCLITMSILEIFYFLLGLSPLDGFSLATFVALATLAFTSLTTSSDFVSSSSFTITNLTVSLFSPLLDDMANGLDDLAGQEEGAVLLDYLSFGAEDFDLTLFSLTFFSSNRIFLCLAS